MTTRSILTTKKEWRIQIPILIIYIYIYNTFHSYCSELELLYSLELREREIITLFPTNSIRFADEFNYLDIMMKQGPLFGTVMMIVIMMTLMSTTMTTAFTPTFHPTKLQSSSSFSSSSTTTALQRSMVSSSYLTDTTVTSPKFPAYTSGSSTTTSTTTTTTVANPPMVAQRWRKSTKQVATLGPASSTLEMIETLFLAGADVFRLNFSHGTTEQKQELVHIIRSIEEKYSHPIAILGDLQGPKLRVRCVDGVSMVCRVCVCVCVLDVGWFCFVCWSDTTNAMKLWN